MEAPMTIERNKSTRRQRSVGGEYSESEQVGTENNVGTAIRSSVERFLAIAVAHDGTVSRSNGHKRESLEELLGVLLQSEAIPATLCFYTEGVRWVTRESPFVDELREICARGADVVACRASMAEAGLIDELAVGRLDTADRIDDMLIDAQHAMVV